MSDHAIGGYFELELPKASGMPHPQAMRFQSARAALTTLLRELHPPIVWIPRYVCRSVPDAITLAGVRFEFYSLDSQLRPGSLDGVGPEDLVLYVNYFGVCDRNVDDLMARFSPERLIVDNAQAFFSPPRNCLATLYSPRKFVGIPDGGLLVSTAIGPETGLEQSESLSRTSHLLLRLAGRREEGYTEFQAGERELSSQPPMSMSSLTSSFLKRIDYDDVAARRRANFAVLRHDLDALNRFIVGDIGDAVPLCYPFLAADPGLREVLRGLNIFAPTYWREVQEWSEPGSIEMAFAERCIALPCDQRYGPDDMQRILEALG